MAFDIKKFINPKFIRTIDPALMKELFTRHFGVDDLPVKFDADPAKVSASLKQYFDAPVTEWSEGLIADLHRVAELGTGEGMQIILNEARRQGVVLFSSSGTDGEEMATSMQEAKHVALHTYLYHHGVFEAAADFQALRAPTAMAEFRGPERDVEADLTDSATARFRAEMVRLLEQDLRGEYCRLGAYADDEEINLAVSHGTPIVTTPVLVGDQEQIVPLQEVKYAVLRYTPIEGLLRIGGVAKARQADVAELFAKHVLDRSGFFSGKDARDLYTLDPISEAGPGFAFDHEFDERILEVRIVAAAADRFERDEEEGKWRHVRTWVSKDASGAALRHFDRSEVRFGRGWRLGEITFRVYFKTDRKRPAQVTARLKPPGTLAFRRTRFEKAVHTLVARNGLEKDRDAGVVVDAAE